MRVATGDMFRSRDVDETRDYVSRLFSLHRLDVMHPGHLNTTIRSRRLQNLSFYTITYGTGVWIESEEADSFFAVQVPVRGRAWARCGAQEAEFAVGDMSVMTPTASVARRWSDEAVQLAVRIERPALEAHLRRVLDTSLARPVLFDVKISADTAPGRSFHDALAFAVSQLRSDGLVGESELAVACLEYGIMTGLLLSARSNYSSALTGTAPRPASRTVSVVRDLLESHPEWPHTVGSLAQAAAVSVRSLERAFRFELGMSPTVYLRTVRLRRVHDALYAAAPDETTVAQVARSWGFVHLGRFATYYRRQFGERPSETLRR